MNIDDKAEALRQKIAGIIYTKLCALGERAKELDWSMSKRFGDVS